MDYQFGKRFVKIYRNQRYRFELMKKFIHLNFISKLLEVKNGKIVYFAPTKASLGVQVHPRAPSGVRPWSRLGHNVCNANLLYGDLHLGSSTGFTTSNFSFMSFPSGAVTFTTILNTLEVVSPLRVLIGMLLAVSFLSWIKYLLEVFYMYFRYSMFFQNNCLMQQ